MKTLSKEITSTFFSSPEKYLELKKLWAEKISKNQEIPCYLHLLYLVLMGKDWTKAFNIGKKVDVSNGAHYNSGTYKAVANLNSKLRNEVYWGKEKYGFLENFVDFKPIFSEGAAKELLKYLPDTKDVLYAVEHLGTPLPEYKDCSNG